MTFLKVRSILENVKNFLHFRRVTKLKKIFGKADEMEKSIQVKSMRWAWTYTTLFLLVWSLYELYLMNESGNFLLWSVNENGNLLPIILLISQSLIWLFSRLIYRALANHGNKDDEEKQSIKEAIIKQIKEGPSPTVISILMIFVVIYWVVRFLMGW